MSGVNTMTIAVEQDNSEILISNVDPLDDPLKRLETEYLESVAQDYPNYKSNNWDFKPKEFLGMESTPDDFENSPAALNEYYNNEKLMAENREEQVHMTLLESIMSSMKFKFGSDLQFDEMKKVHMANEQVREMKHDAYKNKILADFAKQKMEHEISERGLDTEEKLTSALDDKTKGSLHDTTVQLDAAVKEVISHSDKIESFLTENPMVSSEAKKRPLQALDEIQELMKELAESVMKTTSKILDSLCSLFSSNNNSMSAGM
jgi:hypothetical protein